MFNMELKYIILTIIKIVVSVPGILFQAEAAALVGGYLDNTNYTSGGFVPFDGEPKKGEIDESSKSPEEIPNPEPLVIPGYNLPENIFNKGKPFYLEKDPVTGKINFNTTPKIDDDFYDYSEESHGSDELYAKENIDRKDGSIDEPHNHHRPSDINQLSPNFHDFLNLPIKYNPDKYVYPLISNSYANTKVQGNVNKYHNHKTMVTKFPTYNPTFTTKTVRTTPSTTTTTTTTTPSTTTTTTTTRKPTFSEDFSDYEYENNYPSSSFTPSTSTQKVMSLFEQLFGDYDAVTEKTTSKPSTTMVKTTTTEKPTTISYSTTTTTPTPRTTFKVTSSTLPPTEEFYEYEEEQEPPVETPENVFNSHSYKESVSSTESVKVTSLPLGENHVVTPMSTLAPPEHNYRPIIIATQNLRDQLNNERVVPKPFQKLPPSSSKIHIAPDQDTVSFVMGQHQDFSTNSFQPLYEKDDIIYDSPSDNINFPEVTGSVVTIQTPNSEASLSIGVPIGIETKKKPGQVMDAELDHVPTQKIVFPKDKPSPPSNKESLIHHQNLQNHREILKLASKPMFHQLPSDLTPPKEEEKVLRPPWDPRPGHFYTGKLEYSRPPKPVAYPDMTYKRIDMNLPNILPQFRPNMNNNNIHNTNNNKNYLYPHPHRRVVQHHHHREALLERPLSNRPLEFYEKLQPPPLLPTQYRKIPEQRAQERKDEKINNGENTLVLEPPKVISTLKTLGHVETLQMLQAKKEQNNNNNNNENNSSESVVSTEKTVYVVYPVNASPIKLDVLDNPNKESVVIGTRAELPLPPSEIKTSDELPILKPQYRPVHTSKFEFPYPLERPDISVLHPVPDASHNSINSDIPHREQDVSTSGIGGGAAIISNNQWNTVNVESRIVTGNKQQQQAMYTEKPIAVAYTPTEPSLPPIPPPQFTNINHRIEENTNNHRIDDNNNNNNSEMNTLRTEQDFQAPFQASVKVDSPSQGWSVIRRKSDEKSDEINETTTTSSTSGDFDIESFKPHLEGGFKPIYTFPSSGSNDEIERE